MERGLESRYQAIFKQQKGGNSRGTEPTVARLLACHEDMQQVGQGENSRLLWMGQNEFSMYPCSYKTIHAKDFVGYDGTWDF